MIRIMHICSDGTVGGASVTLLRLIKNADKNTFRHIVLLPRSNALFSEFERLDIDLVPLVAPSDRSFTLRGVKECLEHIKKYTPDIIHTHGAVFGRIAGYVGGVRSLVYTRHTYSERKVSHLARFVNRLTTSLAVAVSPAVISQIKSSGIPKSKIKLIENGCDDMSLDIGAERHKSEKYRLLCLGRVTEDKGIRLALEAISILNKRSDTYELRIVGNGEMREFIDSYVKEHSLTNCVTCSPFQADVSSILAESDILLNCSYKNEAASMAILEAFSASMPVCASDVGGNVHIVSHGINGVLYKSGDVNALVSAIDTVVKDYDAFSSNARKTYLSRFASSSMVAEYETVWKEEYERIKS